MTDREFLENLDIPINYKVNTITIPLARYDELLTAWVTLHTLREELEVILGLREEECKTDA